MAGGDNSIEVEGLVREFKKGPRAVDGIDLRVDPGEIYGFLGPNGGRHIYPRNEPHSPAERALGT